MNDLSIIKQHLLFNFIYLLKDTGIPRLHHLHYIVNHPQKLKLWFEEHEVYYRSKHYLSEFLKTYPSWEDRIHLFLEEYGPYVDFLSDNEISLYTGINSKAVQKLREIAFLYRRFD